ncbi:Bet v1-like protein [Gigaspora margarita]|uniref:Bet v1-like protein n=2 Tax=Gigaspora margarita TaxID=4874 RepID=A0A8H4EJL2_GIGMA|nr:Bet v1-like protein [Gigaspora margarita]
MDFDGELRKRPLSQKSQRSLRSQKSQKSQDEIHQIDPLKMTPLYHIKKAKHALLTLKTVVKESGWKKILEHSSGVAIYMKLDNSKNGNIPLIKGELNIQGFTPNEIFSVIEMRDIWDDWYETGNLIERLSESICLTYTVMKGPFQSKDLSLVEKFERSENGTIYYASTSVETLKAPSLNDGNREKLRLSGWILKSVADSPPCTKVVYVIQMNGLLPFDTSKTYLARRPLVINAINKYLQNSKLIITRPVFKPPPRVSSLASFSSFQQLKQVNNFDDNDTSKNRSIRQSRQSSLGNINEYEEDMEQKISDFPMPPEKSITPKPSIEKPLIPKHESQDPSKLIQKPVKSHNYYNEAQKALELFKLLANDPDGWNLYAESKGVKIYQKDSGKPMPYLRGDAVIYGEFHPADILSYITTLDSRKIWDERYEEGSILERYGLDDTMTRVAMKGTFPISGRDLITIGTIERDPATGTIWVADTSIDFPENKKYVRANLTVAGWEFRPNFNGEKIIGVNVKYIVDIDLKLNSVPQSILKMVSMQTPLCIAKIDDSLQKIGFPPYILNTSGTIKNSEFNIKTFQYDVTISINEGTITELRTSKKMYPNGFDISVQPENAKFELLINDNEIVRITVPNDTETLHIRIMNNIEGTQNTFKGKKVATSKDIDPISTLHSEKFDIDPNSTSPLETFGSHEKDIATSKDIDPISTSPLENTAAQKNDESIVLNNELKNRINDQNKSQQNKHEEVTIPVPVKTEHIPPPPKYPPTTSKTELTKNDTKSSNTSIIGFNTREVIMIFSLLLCAYYSGKLSHSNAF